MSDIDFILKLEQKICELLQLLRLRPQKLKIIKLGNLNKTKQKSD